MPLFVRSFASVPSFAITVTGTPFTAFPSLSVIPIIILLSGVIPFIRELNRNAAVVFINTDDCAVYSAVIVIYRYLIRIIGSNNPRFHYRIYGRLRLSVSLGCSVASGFSVSDGLSVALGSSVASGFSDGSGVSSPGFVVRVGSGAGLFSIIFSFSGGTVIFPSLSVISVLSPPALS